MDIIIKQLHCEGKDIQALHDRVIQTDRLSLSAPMDSDCVALSSLWSDPETMRHIGDGSAWDAEKVRARVRRGREVWASRGMCFWTIREQRSGEVIGQGGLVPISFDGDEVELGYRFGRAHWGKGYATEVARASARYGFEVLGVEALVAVTTPTNFASRKVLGKVGFVEVGESDVYYGVRTVVHRMTSRSLIGV